ncbi:ddb1 and cul4 associated factor 7 [Podochytrium sp. JEL0797]|nr:ddb1 and cul4 associated factor 7 [Podochytrium sp. JEL0797]
MAHTFNYSAGFTVYGLAWHQRRDTFRLALGSYAEASTNRVQVVEVSGPSAHGTLGCVAEQAVAYPVTKLLFAPTRAPNPSLLAASSDHLAIYELRDEPPPSNSTFVGHHQPVLPKHLAVKATLKAANTRRQHHHAKNASAPLTSFDWNEVDTSLCVTSSIDTTCTVWDLNRGEQKTQLIAHDKAVYDVSFSRDPNSFASVGADGSVRLFDLRALEHSTILYDTPLLPHPTTPTMYNAPLLRVAWNKRDPNYIATFQADSRRVIVLDVRAPSTPVCELDAHRGVVNAVAWSPGSGSHLCSVADDSFALVWDTTLAPTTTTATTAATTAAPAKPVMTEPLLTYRASNVINNVSWTSGHPEWIGIAVGNGVQALKV